MGRGRNLGAEEILAQLWEGARLARARGMPAVRNLVFMGMGEPLDNLDAVERALYLPCTSPAPPLHQVCWDAEILQHVSRHAGPRPLANPPQPPTTPPETKRGVSQRTPHGCTEGCEEGCMSADEDGCKSADAPRLGDDWLESAQV